MSAPGDRRRYAVGWDAEARPSGVSAGAHAAEARGRLGVVHSLLGRSPCGVAESLAVQDGERRHRVLSVAFAACCHRYFKRYILVYKGSTEIPTERRYFFRPFFMGRKFSPRKTESPGPV